MFYCASTKGELSAHPALPLLVGRYAAAGGENHGKPVYKKICAAADAWDVHLYYWDGRDGPSFAGWRFGPLVGGAQVFARNPASFLGGHEVVTMGPPRTGWVISGMGSPRPGFEVTEMVVPSQVEPELTPPELHERHGP